MTREDETTVETPPLARLAHELRTPLAAIVGLSDAMSAQILGPLPPAYEDYARLIRQAGTHAILVLDALTADAAAGPGDAAAPAGQVVRDVADAMRPGLIEKGLHLDLDLGEAAAAALTPRRAMGQILFNLIANARNATAVGGHVAVKLSLDSRRVRLEVADTGAAGADPRAAQPGAGVGLSVVRALCAAHGGEFELRTTAAGAVARAWLTPVTR